jgi:TPR repeat protein
VARGVVAAIIEVRSNQTRPPLQAFRQRSAEQIGLSGQSSQAGLRRRPNKVVAWFWPCVRFHAMKERRHVHSQDSLGYLAGYLCGALLLAILSCACSKPSKLAAVTAQAKRGDPEAQCQLGMYYHEGLEVAPDYQAAGIWFHKAAEQEHPVAQLALGKMYLNGEGVLPDEVQAAMWIRKAAEQGFAPAQDELASMHLNGIGVVKDEAEAVNWATKAAEQGFTDAQFHLGCLLSSNVHDGVTPDNVAASVWLSLAAAEGHLEAEELLATLKARSTPAQLEDAKSRVERWKQAHPKLE